MATLYEFPEYYDILFGWDRDAEAQHYEHALVQHGVRQATPILEVAAGTAQISIRLARRGCQVTSPRGALQGLKSRREPVDLENRLDE